MSGAAGAGAEAKRRKGTGAGAGVGRWTEAEEAQLTAAIKTHGEKAWKLVAAAVTNRSEIQCLQHHKQVMNTKHITRGRGSWTDDEDKKLVGLVTQFGTKKWAKDIAPQMPGRMGKQCRERWVNKLNPNLRTGAWASDEEDLLASLHAELGNRWATIAQRMGSTRSENDVKNHYYAKKRRKGPGHAAKRRKKAEGGHPVPAKKARVDPAPAARKYPTRGASSKLDESVNV